MAESITSVVPEADILALKEALYAQKQLLQQLYSELDAEREASSSAASEALSMILRLQGEKASLKMEASQYKRMAEEKICHTEEALAVFEDLIYQREMEIASLEYLVQAYRYRLICMGCNDLGVYENKFPENLLMQRNDTLFGEKGVTSNIRRLNSLPQFPMKDSNQKKNGTERIRSPILGSDSISSVVEESESVEINDLEKKVGGSAGEDINAYWEQIKKLDERLKEISDGKDSGRNKSTLWRDATWSPSLFSQLTSSDATKEVNLSSSDHLKQNESLQEKEADRSSCSSIVQDIFEVPQATEVQKLYVPRKLYSDVENRLVKPDVVSDDFPESHSKDGKDQMKPMLLSPGHKKRIPKLRDGTGLERSICHPTTSVCDSHAEYQQLSRRIERLERARNNVRQEIVAEGEEELNLLKEIREQLNIMQSEMRSMKAKKPLLPNEPSLDPLRDAMLYFWL